MIRASTLRWLATRPHDRPVDAGSKVYTHIHSIRGGGPPQASERKGGGMQASVDRRAVGGGCCLRSVALQEALHDPLPVDLIRVRRAPEVSGKAPAQLRGGERLQLRPQRAGLPAPPPARGLPLLESGPRSSGRLLGRRRVCEPDARGTGRRSSKERRARTKLAESVREQHDGAWVQGV